MSEQVISQKELLLDKLKSYKAIDLSDQMKAERLIKVLCTESDPFSREQLPGHFTASAWVVSHDGKSVILLLHKKLNLWLQPGGHADGIADLEQVARTELREECGLSDVDLVNPEIFNVDIHTIPKHENVPRHFHYDVCFAFRAKADTRLIVSDESHEVRWVSLDQVGMLTRDSTIEKMLKRWERWAAAEAVTGPT